MAKLSKKMIRVRERDNQRTKIDRAHAESERRAEEARQAEAQRPPSPIRRPRRSHFLAALLMAAAVSTLPDCRVRERGRA